MREDDPNKYSYADDDWYPVGDSRLDTQGGYEAFDEPGQYEPEMSAVAYNLRIGAFLLYGFVVNAIICSVIDESILLNYFVLFFMGYFVCTLTGSALSQMTDRPVIAFIGYNLLVIPIGVVLSAVTLTYDMGTIQYVFFVTALVTVIMMGLAMAAPNVFLSMGALLAVSLLAGLVVEVVMMILGKGNGTIDMLFVAIFCGYIGYDWAKAQNSYRSTGVAIAAASQLYLDIVNVFLRLLRILGRGKGNSRN